MVAAAGIDAFFGSPLDPVLRSLGTDLLLLVGLGLETTVHSTMRSANDRGYECLLVVDACAPLDPDAVPNAVSMVEMSGGIFGAVGLTDPVLAALTRALNNVHHPPEGTTVTVTDTPQHRTRRHQTADRCLDGLCRRSKPTRTRGRTTA